MAKPLTWLVDLSARVNGSAIMLWVVVDQCMPGQFPLTRYVMSQAAGAYTPGFSTAIRHLITFLFGA